MSNRVYESLPMSKQIVPVPTLDPHATSHAYSQCVKAGPLVFLSGQCGIVEKADGTRGLASTEFEPQARVALNRVRTIVEAAGGTIDQIVTMTVFVTDIRLGKRFTAIRKEFFGADFPTSALIGVSALMTPGALIEIQAAAVIP